MSSRTARQRLMARGDEGFSLVEMMVVLVALAVLLAITVPIISTVLQTTSRIRNTYTNLNSQLSLSTTLQRLLRAAVAPAPSFVSTTPVPPFERTKVTPTSLTFFSNTGTANGPEQVTASCTETPTHTTLCAPTATFTLSVTPAKATSCPFKETTTKSCTWSTTSKRTLLVISDVTNGDSAQPLFTYSCTSTACSSATTFAKTCHADGTVNTAHTYTADDPFATCQAGEIDEVAYDLSFDAKVTKTKATQTTPRYGGFQTQTESGTFVMSSTSMLYSPVVG